MSKKKRKPHGNKKKNRKKGNQLQQKVDSIVSFINEEAKRSEKLYREIFKDLDERSKLVKEMFLKPCKDCPHEEKDCEAIQPVWSSFKNGCFAQATTSKKVYNQENRRQKEDV